MSRYGALWPLMTPPAQQGLDDLCAVSARGVRVTLLTGRELLCATSGLWNSNLGYGNPAVAGAVTDALLDASYLGAWSMENVYARRASAELVELAGSDHFARVLFSTSGGAANDVAIKLVRQFHVIRGDSERRGVLALSNAFHGLTFGSSALTDANLGQQMYGVDRRLVGRVPVNEPAQLEATLDRHEGRIAALFVEPVLGTGAIPLTDEYIDAIVRLRRKHGFLLVADEVSTGFGRVGTTAYATARWPEPPDILITAKALTNGTMAASAVIVSGEVADAFFEPDVLLGHAETQAGTSVVGAAITATIAEMRRLDTPTRSMKLGQRLDVELALLVAEEPLVSTTTGMGCMRALHLCTPDGSGPLPQSEMGAVIKAIRAAGAIVHPGPSCLQIIPALVYSDADLDELMATVRSGLHAYAAATARA